MAAGQELGGPPSRLRPQITQISAGQVGATNRCRQEPHLQLAEGVLAAAARRRRVRVAAHAAQPAAAAAAARGAAPVVPVLLARVRAAKGRG